MAFKCCPLSKSIRLSDEKAEKVVNPPQKPVASNKRRFSEIKFLPAKEISIPIKKHPARLTARVP